MCWKYFPKTNISGAMEKSQEWFEVGEKCFRSFPKDIIFIHLEFIYLTQINYLELKYSFHEWMSI